MRTELNVKFRKTLATPLGTLDLFCSNIGMTGVYFEQHKMPYLVNGDDHEQVTSHPLMDWFERELAGYFLGRLTSFTTPLDLATATPFQRRVWNSLLDIPYGKVISYSEQARDFLQMPKSFRAVALANSRNPLSILIPCHRVIAKDGSLHGYAGGLSIKKRLLELEGHQIVGLALK